MEVEITWGRIIRVWWAYLWRNLIAVILAAITGWIIGFILGFIMGAMGIAPTTSQIVTAPLGALFGLAFSVIPMKMILGKDFGQFRLVLVSKA
ncbi:hypothetical protein [Desulfobulbus elongatus]|uniref:hypothetical protein n=1 Tax=Desulfobulbus elongatus TaxID=53332 RepID=UPI0004870913|nr:hypothetical protein [Desulfobulbus elongatus]